MSKKTVVLSAFSLLLLCPTIVNAAGNGPIPDEPIERTRSNGCGALEDTVRQQQVQIQVLKEEVQRLTATVNKLQPPAGGSDTAPAADPTKGTR